MRVRIVLILTILLSQLVFCMGETETDSTKTYIFDPITITATRTEVKRSVVAPSISVIDQDALKLNPQKSILSIVSQQVPGVFVQERGVLGFGVATSSAGQFSIRGIGGSPNTQVLMMIDGKPQFMGMMGHPLADSYLSANAERVEVIRGSSSVLYGSNAMGGVINIITHSTNKEGVTGNVSLQQGSYNSQHFGWQIGYNDENWNAIASFTYAHTDGHRPESQFNANSGYVKTSVNIDERHSVTVDGSITKFKTYDPGTIYSPKTTNNMVDIRRGYTSLSIDNNYGITKGSFQFVYNFGHHEVDETDWVSDDYNIILSFYQNLKLFPHNTITIGGDINKYGGEGKNRTRNYGAPSVYEYGIYTNIQQLLFEKLMLNGGIRYARHEVYGSEIVPQIGMSLSIVEGSSIRASASKGYRSPTIRELYLFPAPTPTLKPERMWTYEVGASQIIYDKLSADITLFVSEGDNLIRYIPPPTKILANSGSFIHRGVEFAGTYLPPIDNLKLQCTYSFIEPQKETRSVPKHKIYVFADYKYGIFEPSISVQHVEVLYGKDGSIDRLPNYTLVNLKVGARINNQVSLSISAENLLDQTYYTMYGYPMPGTSVSIGMRVRF